MMKQVFFRKQNDKSHAFDKNQMHMFTRENRKFAINLQPLTLYKIIGRVNLLTRQRRYVPVTINPSNEHVKIGARNTFIPKQEEAGIYCYMNISHSCNMSCLYCFAKKGMYGGPEELMDLSIAKETIDWLCRACKGREVSINFFGGEPLINPTVLYETISYAKSQARHRNKTLRVSVSTNGTHDLNALGIALTGVRHNIAISIDGPPPIQNNNRPLRNGCPSYEKIKTRVSNYIEYFGADHISAKATWRRGQSNLVDVANNLMDMGFVNISICRESSFGGGSIEPENKGHFKDFDEILFAYDKLLGWYIQHLNVASEIVVEPLATTMRAILESRITKSRCPVGSTSFCVTPEGDIYPCHRFVGNKSYVLGNICNVERGYDVPLVCKTVTSLPQACANCWARYWCVSENCVYLSAIGKDLRLSEGYCKHIKDFLETICFHLSNLSDEGRQHFLVTQGRA